MRITVDLAKASTEPVDLTGVLNPRVGDGDLKLPFHLMYNGDDEDMRGKSMDFLSEGSDKKKIYVSGTVDESTKGDDPYTGNVTFTFPTGTFKTPGAYDVDKTMFRVINNDDHSVISTVNVKMNVLPNDSDVESSDDVSYDSRMEKIMKDYADKGQASLDDAKQKAQQIIDDANKQATDYLNGVKKQGEDLLDEIKQTNSEAKGNVAGDTAATATQAKQLANDNSGKIHDLQGEVGDARGRFMTLSDRENKQDFNIDRKEDKANANANYAAQDLRNDQQDKEIAKKANQNFITDYLSQMYLQPEGFENEAALKAKYPDGHPGIMVTVDTGHKWVWTNNAWKDCGIYQAVGLPYDEQQVLHNAVHGKNIVYDDAASKPPYNDLNLLEENTIVTYTTDITKARHAPENQILGSTLGATVITLNYSSNSVDGAGKIQFMFTDKADQFIRTCWGNPPTWSEWKSSILRSYPIVYAATLAAPFDNLDTIPANSLVVYADSISDLQGAPDKALTEGSTGATVLTLSSHISGYNAGTIQILILDNGKTFNRIIWGKDPKYTDWQYFLTPKDFMGIMAYDKDVKDGGRYADLDRLPVNTTVTYAVSNADQLMHYPSNVPGTVRTFSCSLDESAGEFQILVDSNNVLYHRIYWGNPATWGTWKSEPKHIDSSISLFQNIGIIGDSYASGELYVDGKYNDHYDISWGQILARKNGIKAVNFSKGGLTTRAWLADDHGLALLNSSDPQDLYVIVLGINDYQKLGDPYLGVENDVNTGADTFYGNYGKIISTVKFKAPQAKIVLATMSYDAQGTAHNYNEAIKTLAKHFGLPVIVQNEDPLFTSDFYLNHMVGGHPTAPVYAGMANAFQRLIEKSMVENLDYFMTYKQ